VHDFAAPWSQIGDLTPRAGAGATLPQYFSLSGRPGPAHVSGEVHPLGVLANPYTFADRSTAPATEIAIGLFPWIAVWATRSKP
jgi:hypothetical protein